jgi:hypothetical protein
MAISYLLFPFEKECRLTKEGDTEVSVILGYHAASFEFSFADVSRKCSVLISKALNFQEQIWTFRAYAASRLRKTEYPQTRHHILQKRKPQGHRYETKE